MLRMPQIHRKNNNRTFDFISSRQIEGYFVLYDLGYDDSILVNMAVYEDNDNNGNNKLIGIIPESYFPIDPETGKPLCINLKVLGIDYINNVGQLQFSYFNFFVKVPTRSYYYGTSLCGIVFSKLNILRANNFFNNTKTVINV